MADDLSTLSVLAPAQRETVAWAVQAAVEDRTALAPFRFGATDDDYDDFAILDDFGDFGSVKLRLPDGPSETWAAHIVQEDEWAAVDVLMWIEEHPDSVLFLDVEVTGHTPGAVHLLFRGLHF